ncbi:MAG: LamG domain-containing protein [Magnetococcus sp. DMHC-6]
MAILTTDIKLIKATKQSDADNAGGYMGASEVVDGVSNNLFPDISRLDRTYSRIQLRKVFAAVRSVNTDTWLGAHVCLTDPPDDPNVTLLLLNPGDGDDGTRADCVNYLDAYWMPQDELAGQLLNTVAAGSAIFELINHPELEVGDVLWLEEADLGSGEFCRVINRTYGYQTLKITFPNGSFYYKTGPAITTVEVAAPLKFGYNEGVVPRYAIESGNWRVYGVSTLAQAANTGSIQITLTALKQALLPASEYLRQLTGIQAWRAADHSIEMPVPWSASTGATWWGATVKEITLHLPAGSIAPGSFSAYFRWGNNTIWTQIADDGDGAIVTTAQDGLITDNSITGTIDYSTGQVDMVMPSITGQSGGSSWIYFKRTPVDKAYTYTQSVSAMGVNYSTTLTSPVLKKSVTISFVRGGVWLFGSDDGAGLITGDMVGSINYATGAIILTLSGDPDTGTSVLFRSWSSDFMTIVQDELSLGFIEAAGSQMILAHAPVLKGSLVLEYLGSGSVITYLWDGGDGQLYSSANISTGDSSVVGTIDYETGIVTIAPGLTALYPSYSSLITGYSGIKGYWRLGESLGASTVADSSGLGYTGTCFGNPTFGVFGPGVVGSNRAVSFDGVDDKIEMGTIANLINFTTGSFSISAWVKSASNGSAQGILGFDRLVSGAEQCAYRFRTNGSLIYFDVQLNLSSVVSLSSVVNLAGDNTWHFLVGVRSSNVLYFYVDGVLKSQAACSYTMATPSNDAQFRLGVIGTYAFFQGSLDEVAVYSAALSQADIQLRYNGGVTAKEYAYGTPVVTSVYLRTDAYPIQAGTYSIQGLDLQENTPYIGSDNGTGAIIGEVTGTIDYETGTVHANFPVPIADGSITQSYGYTAYLSPDPAILGVDISALPEDGKPAIFKVGDVIILQEGANEDMALVTGVAGNTVTLSTSITHDYTTAATASSALLIGDLQAKMGIYFDQATWSGTWSDTLSGSAATGEYDFVNYPLTLTNKGCVSDRWAVKFTSATAFELHSQRKGLITTGTTSTTLAPNNPDTGVPYFSISSAGWSGGWSYGNAVRFNTIDAAAPFWVARVIQSGASGVVSDQANIQLRGDEDA